MNKLVAKFAGILVVALVFSVSMTFTGCDKEINCKAVIKVVSVTTGDPIVGASVRVWQGDVELTSTTDGSGTVNFETNLPMILDIEVNGNATGRVARFEDDKTDNVTVEI